MTREPRSMQHDRTSSSHPLTHVSPVTSTTVLLVLALIASAYSLAKSDDPGILDLPLVAAPLAMLYWVARQLGDDAAIGWMIFGSTFIIVVPVVMFALLLSFASRGGVDPDLGIRFDALMTVGPVVQLIATGLLFLFARMVRGPRG